VSENHQVRTGCHRLACFCYIGNDRYLYRAHHYRFHRSCLHCHRIHVAVSPEQNSCLLPDIFFAWTYTPSNCQCDPEGLYSWLASNRRHSPLAHTDHVAHHHLRRLDFLLKRCLVDRGDDASPESTVYPDCNHDFFLRHCNYEHPPIARHVVDFSTATPIRLADDCAFGRQLHLDGRHKAD